MFDFHSVYLNGVLDNGETIYMEQLPYHEVADCSRYVIKLRKSLYGLKQAGRKWYDTLSGSLAAIGFQKSMADPAVFFIHVGSDIVILFIHVDDTTMTGSSMDLIKRYEQQIGEMFDITHLGPVSWLLGLAITRDRSKRALSISQEAYINSVIRRFNLEDSKPLSTPIDSNTRLLKDDCPTSAEDKQEMKDVPYRELIGALNWLAVGSQPDITFVIGQLAQFLENPGRVHWDAAKRVVRYLKSTKDLKLTYGGGDKHGFEGYSDADGATQDHRHTISGFAVLVDGGAVSWSSKKQELVTLSTMEAEYVGATHAAKELIWFRHLIEEIFHPLSYPIVLHLDNQSAIALANSEGQFHACTKHIDICYHFIKFAIQNGTIILLYCPTKNMIADILTKSVPLIKHKYMTHDLGLVSV
jgi:Reverse transcriptase (RNA-dependent DNA polymerase)